MASFKKIFVYHVQLEKTKVVALERELDGARDDFKVSIQR